MSGRSIPAWLSLEIECSCRYARIVTPEELANLAHLRRAAYGETPYAYLMTRRIERAKALLRRGDMSVTEVCVAVGCTSLGSFSRDLTRPDPRVEQDRRNAEPPSALALPA